MKKLFTRLQAIVPILIIIFLILITVALYVYFNKTQGRVSIDDSLLQAPIVTVAPATPGILQEIDVYEGETVQEGQLLGIVAGQPLYAQKTSLVVQANTQLGGSVSSTSPLVSLITTGTMRVAGTIDENKGLADIQVGQVASFTVDALPGKTFWGYVDEVSPASKVTQISFSISSERPTQQFVVYVNFDTTKYPELKQGMSAKTTILTKTK